MCDNAVDSCLQALKFVPDWFVTSKVIEELDSAVFSNDYIVFGDLNSDFGTFFSSYIGLNSMTPDNVGLDDVHFDYCDPETINHVKLIALHDKYNQHKAPKKDKGRIAVCSMASNKMVGLVYVRRWKEKLAASFYSLNLTLKLDYCE